MTAPIDPAAIVATGDGRVFGFADIAAARSFLEGRDDCTVWTAAGFWRRERDARADEDAVTFTEEGRDEQIIFPFRCLRD